MPTFLFDLDGTITRREILPEIALLCGLGQEMATLTRQTMDGMLPFRQSFLKRVSMLRNVPISAAQEAVAAIPLLDCLVDWIRAHRDDCIIVTGNLDVWVAPICRRIGVRAITSTAIFDGDRLLDVCSVLDKYELVGRIAAERGRPIVALGDGNNDAGMIEAADIGIATGIVNRPAISVLQACTHAVYDEATLCRFLSHL